MLTLHLIELLCLFFVIYTTILFYYRKGPMPLPFLGHMHLFDFLAPHKTLSKLAKKYGTLIKINFFSKEILLVSGAQQIKTVLIKDTFKFSNRPKFFRFSFLTGGYTGLVMTDGTEEWHKQKQAVLRALLMYDTNGYRFELLTQKVIDDLCEIGSKKEIWDLNLDISMSLINILTSLVLGKSFGFNSPQLTAYSSAMDLSAEASFKMSGMILEIFPWLMHFNIPYGVCKDMKFSRKVVTNFLLGEIDSALETYNPNNEVRGLVDTLYKNYLEDKERHECDLSLDEFKRQTLYPICLDVITGGYMTTARALQALFLIYLHHPDLQTKIQKEIDQVSELCLSNKTKMPYAYATCFELLRYISHVPFGLPHVASDDSIKIDGMPIRKGTEIWINLWSLHHDPEIWKDPWTFKPERFMENGLLVGPNHILRRNLFVFGAGRRVCAGKIMAMNRLFLIIINLMKRFTFQSTGKLPSCDPRDFKFSAILKPDDYLVKVVKRF